MAADLPSSRQVWAQGAGEASETDFAAHVNAIAHGRYVMRHILHILDEQAVGGGLQPLLHQALLQVYGADDPLSVSELADRLAVASALMSRMVRRLEEDGLVERVRATDDRRVTRVRATAAGVEVLRAIDLEVHEQVHQFHRRLSDESKLGALATFASYLGLDSDPRLRELLAGADIDVDAHARVHSGLPGH
ncbi:MAG TPA: MarR family transcriptional regulator [Trebonia sp.]|jgi:DNA-binding MarR family transcriptional regulator